MMNDNRLRRDLNWCLTSPSLLAAELWCEQPALQALPINLPAPPHPHRFRLGRQFEQLLLAWLEFSERFHCRQHNLQVQNGKRTIGEFDFLVETGGQVEHWEAAVKFYLGTGDLTQAHAWFGPNTDDRLDIKLDRLTSHQLRLAEHPVAQAQLAALGIEVARVRCFMKGRLFHPWNRFATGQMQAPELINPAHGRGWWISYEDFLRDFEPHPWRYVYLPKSLWLAPLLPADIEQPLSFVEMTELLAVPGTEQAAHIAVVDDTGEKHRGFVVNRQWLMRVNESGLSASNL